MENEYTHCMWQRCITTISNFSFSLFEWILVSQLFSLFGVGRFQSDWEKKCNLTKLSFFIFPYQKKTFCFFSVTLVHIITLCVCCIWVGEERENERERDSVCVCEKEWDAEVREWKRQWERQRQRKSERVKKWEREW